MNRADPNRIAKVVVALTAGDHAQVGDEGIAVGGPDAVVRAGYHGVAAVKGPGEAYVEKTGIAFAFGYGKATGGAQNISVAGIAPQGGTPPAMAVAGDSGIAIAGNGGYAQTGRYGVIIIYALVPMNQPVDPRLDARTPFVGLTEPLGCLKPYTWYHLDAAHEFTEGQPLKPD